MDGEERLRGEVLGLPPAAGGADEEVRADGGQPAGHAGQHDQEGHAGGADVLTASKERNRGFFLLFSDFKCSRNGCENNSKNAEYIFARTATLCRPVPKIED